MVRSRFAVLLLLIAAGLGGGAHVGAGQAPGGSPSASPNASVSESDGVVLAAVAPDGDSGWS